MGGPGRPALLRVAPALLEPAAALLAALNLTARVVQEDVQVLVERDVVVAANSSYSPELGHPMEWTTYHSIQDMEDYMMHLAATFDWVAVETIGQSYEGREMLVARLCRGGCGGKPAVWVDAGIHAREWVTPMVATFLLRELVEQEDAHPHLTKELDWYILSVMNPDGALYSQQDYTTRMWRKTRSMDPDGLGLCLGADANRNWGFHFGDGGSSEEPCSDQFMGAAAFSEVENKNVRDFLLAHREDVKLYNSLHSFSQLVLLPWGWTTDPPPSFPAIQALAEHGNAALAAVHGTEYTVGCIPCLLYPASGGSLDWVLGEAGIPYAYAMELRDTGDYGFMLPAREIVPTGEEVWAFHQAVAEKIIEEFGARHSS